jgi:hypothetical protein
VHGVPDQRRQVRIGLEHPSSKSRRTDRQFVGFGTEEDGAKQLTRGPPAHRLLQRTAPRAQHAEPTRLGEIGRVGQQARLTDPGRPVDEHQPTSPGPRPGQLSFERPNLGVTLE